MKPERTVVKVRADAHAERTQLVGALVATGHVVWVETIEDLLTVHYLVCFERGAFDAVWDPATAE